MASSKKPFPFTGKESKKEEKAEKSVGKAAYARGEKAEGVHGKKTVPGMKKGGKVC